MAQLKKKKHFPVTSHCFDAWLFIFSLTQKFVTKSQCFSFYRHAYIPYLSLLLGYLVFFAQFTNPQNLPIRLLSTSAFTYSNTSKFEPIFY